MTIDGSLKELSRRALSELDTVMAGLPEDAAAPLIDAIADARHVVVYSAGREGLAIRGFAMRLFHMGVAVHVVGDMTTPRIGADDLLIVSSGPGDLATAETLVDIAAGAGARTAIVTAQPDGKTARKVDIRLVIPAQTMADDHGDTVSVLPMGSLFELAETLLFDLIILKLRDRLGETAHTMRARHTNME